MNTKSENMTDEHKKETSEGKRTEEGSQVLSGRKEQLDVASEDMHKVERILDLPLTVNVNISKLTMTLNELVNLVPGSVIELEKKVDEPLDIVISNSKKVARGEVVTIGENLGIRIIAAGK
jgi:flagellar motor switch protein FliN